MRPRPRRAAPHRSPLLRRLLPTPPPPHPLRRLVPLLRPPLPPPRPTAAAASSPSRPAPPRPAPVAVARQRGREMPGMPGGASRRHGGVGAGSGAARCGLRRDRAPRDTVPLRAGQSGCGPWRGLPCPVLPRPAPRCRCGGTKPWCPGQRARQWLRCLAQPGLGVLGDSAGQGGIPHLTGLPGAHECAMLWANIVAKALAAATFEHLIPSDWRGRGSER